MGRSRGRGRSESEFLKGRVRELEKELKYYRRQSREHEQIIDEVINDSDLELINIRKCPLCYKGALQTFDFIYATLDKCSHCDYEKKYKKKKT
jgi:hypothetical protein